MVLSVRDVGPSRSFVRPLCRDPPFCHQSADFTRLCGVASSLLFLRDNNHRLPLNRPMSVALIRRWASSRSGHTPSRLP